MESVGYTRVLILLKDMESFMKQFVDGRNVIKSKKYLHFLEEPAMLGIRCSIQISFRSVLNGLIMRYNAIRELKDFDSKREVYISEA